MNNSDKRLQFLESYRMHIREELDQMGIGKTVQETIGSTPDGSGFMTSIIALTAMALIFASIFLVQ